MFNFKSQLLGAAAVLPVVAAGLLGSAGSAQAAALTGSVQFNGGQTAGIGTTLTTLKTNSLTFNPQSPDTFGANNGSVAPVSIGLGTGSFGNGTNVVTYNSAGIRNITSFTPTTVQNPFLDFGNLLVSGAILGPNTYNSIIDESTVFNLSNASYGFEQVGNLVNISVHLLGNFVSSTNDVSAGEGILTFQATDTTVAAVQTQIGTNAGLTATFSGGLFTTKTVPEPTTILGLGFVAAGMTVARRRKSVTA